MPQRSCHPVQNTIAVPDCRGANRLWLSGERFPALDVGPDDGIIQVMTGVKTLDLSDREKRLILCNNAERLLGLPASTGVGAERQ